MHRLPSITPAPETRLMPTSTQIAVCPFEMLLPTIETLLPAMNSPAWP